MKGRQRAKIILNGTWYVQQTSPYEYPVYHEFYVDGKRHLLKKAVMGCIHDALEYIMNSWFEK